MHEMGLRRILDDAASSGSTQLIERVREIFNNEEWSIIQSRYAWWSLGVNKLMDQEPCASLEAATERLQEKIRNAKNVEDIMDIRLLFNGGSWLTIQARFYWWMIGVEKFQATSELHMTRVRIDDVVETVALKEGKRGGWYTYNIIRDGQPVSEISVSVKLDQPFVAFRTGGHKFERVK